ncbi:hypothetical protein QTP88_026625 [Uroleucon formosanum]
MYTLYYHTTYGAYGIDECAPHDSANDWWYDIRSKRRWQMPKKPATGDTVCSLRRDRPFKLYQQLSFIGYPTGRRLVRMLGNSFNSSFSLANFTKSCRCATICFIGSLFTIFNILIPNSPDQHTRIMFYHK